MTKVPLPWRILIMPRAIRFHTVFCSVVQLLNEACQQAASLGNCTRRFPLVEMDYVRLNPRC